MAWKISTIVALAAILPSTLGASVPPSSLELQQICTSIQGAVSSASAVFYPGSANYIADNAHWLSSSSQPSVCSVEPGTAADVSIILQLLNSTRTPFGIKGGGHIANVGFSSTLGVQISMTRFSDITYDEESQTVDIGSGLIWDDVYAALEPHGAIVAGARVSGVGVGGFVLGGGYNWLTNQVGLTIDTVTAFELVKPDGNIGIVTKFTLKTFLRDQVWGGVISYSSDQMSAVQAAITNFTTSTTDPKAQIIAACNFMNGSLAIGTELYYDAPTPPPGIFDEFLSIPSTFSDISTRSFLGAFHAATVVEFTPTMVAAIFNETTFWGNQLADNGAFLIEYNIEPFLPNLFSHGAPSAYPPSRDIGYLPINLNFGWTPASSDAIFHAALRVSAQHLTNVAVHTGQPVINAPLYTNYALGNTLLERMYGDHVPRLRAIKALEDPHNVMGLAGGFKF
ncbi:FAD-binding domain-containing protein [Mycena metata]|uniref:FAD-binding domain-containing protein n=1 Tax=Mycena metata TaxID=1033252 RepID=A0AAD7IJX4_9AGAR|nr:FAD-binding domain-containing protein [Mycena metata]